jgi:hypothetical protein
LALQLRQPDQRRLAFVGWGELVGAVRAGLQPPPGLKQFIDDRGLATQWA